jgi:hypothetical protein
MQNFSYSSSKLYIYFVIFISKCVVLSVHIDFTLWHRKRVNYVLLSDSSIPEKYKALPHVHQLNLQ